MKNKTAANLGSETNGKGGPQAKDSSLAHHAQMADARGLGEKKQSRTKSLRLEGLNSVCPCQGRHGEGRCVAGGPSPQSQ